MKTLFLCGAGNSEGVRLALRVARATGRWDRLQILDDDPLRLGDELCGVPVVGPIEMLADMDPATTEAFNLVARTTKGRAAVRERIAGFGIPLAEVVHPTVDVEWAELCDDVTVYEHAVVSPETVIGPGSVVFMRAVVGHEAHVGRGCVLAAGSVLNARVELGDGVYVGSNASILPEVRVGAGATIGANSMVVADVPEGATVIGVPGQVVGVPGGEAETVGPVGLIDSGAEFEDVLLQIWGEVLEQAVDRVDVAFFDVGGTSLLALRVLQLVRDQIGREVPMTDFYRFPTVRGLASHLGSTVSPGGEATVGWARGARRRARVMRARGTG